ncbi:putative protein T-ENOL isoform 1-T1 [Megaptera novaeangliae]
MTARENPYSPGNGAAEPPQTPREMASSATRNVEKKGSGQSQATTSAASLGGGPKVSHSEEFLTQISTELTDEALFVAAYRMNPMPIKEKQTQDQGTQISKHGSSA